MATKKPTLITPVAKPHGKDKPKGDIRWTLKIYATPAVKGAKPSLVTTRQIQASTPTLKTRVRQELASASMVLEHMAIGPNNTISVRGKPTSTKPSVSKPRREQRKGKLRVTDKGKKDRDAIPTI
jgi:hypothetical protein